MEGFKQGGKGGDVKRMIKFGILRDGKSQNLLFNLILKRASRMKQDSKEYFEGRGSRDEERDSRPRFIYIILTKTS